MALSSREAPIIHRYLPDEPLRWRDAQPKECRGAKGADRRRGRSAAGEVGPDRLSTEAIARDVGLTQAGVFRHFATKDRLWEAVASWIGQRLQERWTAATASEASAARRLRALVQAQLGLIQSTPAIPAILLSRELHARNDALRASLYGLLQRFQRLLTAIIEEGRAAGEFRSDLEAGDAALLVISAVQGVTVRWSLSGRSFDLVAEGGRLLDVLLRGFGAPEHA